MAQKNLDQYVLEREDGVLLLKRLSTNEKVFVDFSSGEFRQRLKTISKSQPLFKAMAIEPGDQVIDATAGLGTDALCFLHLGALVVAIEENETVFALLEDGVRRAAKDDSVRALKNLKLVHQSSLVYMRRLLGEGKSNLPHSVYLDPMYPVTEKSAKPKKQMAFLREILEPTLNVEELLEAALACAQKRVVLKRPVGSPALGKPHHSYESKMVRFDMYLMNRRIM